MSKRNVDMLEIMIDIETLANDERAAVLSVGAVVINSLTNEIVDEQYWVLNWEEQIRDQHRSMSPENLKWWFSQPQEASRVIHELVPRLGSEDFVKELYAYFEKHNTKTVWVNGASFDIGILDNFIECNQVDNVTYRYKTPPYGDMEIIRPWHWGSIFCMRSMRNLFKDYMSYSEFKKKEIAAGATAHNALDDARIQAKYVLGVREWLKSRP